MDRDRRRTILGLALPTVGGMTSQNILNLVDMAMVGALGPAALAAVGIGSFVNFMAFAAIAGLSSAVQASAARRVGEGKLNETALPLNGGLTLCVLIGLPITIALWFLSPAIMAALNKDPEVVKLGAQYLQMRSIGIVALGMNFAYRGYWTAIKNTKLYFHTLLIMHTINILLNYALIFGKFGFPALGVLGAGIGTSISLIIGSLIYSWHGWRLARPAGFLQREASYEQMKTLLRIAIPSCIQQFLFAAGFTVLFWIIGQVGTSELAVSNVLINITLVAILPGMGLGLAAATLVGQALGRKDIPDAHRWAWDVARIGVQIFAVMGLAMLFAPKLILSAFLHEPELLELGAWPLRMVGLLIVFDGVGLILMQALLGAGASAVVMTVSVSLQWFLFLPIAWLVGPYLGFGLMAIWIAFGAYRGLQAAAFISVWERGKWSSIKV